MINLTPIPIQIQKRMFEKMRALQNHKSEVNAPASTERLTFDHMATRSTFIKMVSNQTAPRTIMGGLLKIDNSMYAGYDMYNPRGYVQHDGMDGAAFSGPPEAGFTGTEGQNRRLQAAMGADYAQKDNESHSVWKERRKRAFEDQNLGSPSDVNKVNPNSRPIPGIKSIDVSFKGGAKASREATINWTCWDWEELDQLMPHFLAHGKTVLLEWGWVYGRDSLLNIPSLAGPDGYISEGAFKDFSDVVIEGKGDFDFMVGLVKNFEFSTRTDGAFDCQTIISSVGVNIFESPTPTRSTLDPGTQYNLNSKQAEADVVAKLIGITGDKDKPLDGDKNGLLTFDTNVSLKMFVANIDDYILEQLGGNIGPEKTSDDWGSQPLTGTEVLRWKSNKFLAKIDPYGQGSVKNAWMKWGWFEDNVLNKFLGMTNGKGEKIIEFKSIESKESTLLRNHKFLETIDINNHILPGQFYPQGADTYEFDGKDYPLEGDSKDIQILANVAKNHFDHYDSKGYVPEDETNAKGQTMKAVTEAVAVGYDEYVDTEGFEDNEEDINIRKRNQQNPERTVESEYALDDLMAAKPKNSRYGFLRNILVNTKIIKEAFGVNEEGDSMGVESINLMDTLDYMFDLLNQDVSFWDLNITTDSQITSRAKIVDDGITAYDFIKTDKELGILGTKSVYSEDIGDILPSNLGVFYFPVWRTDSFVKSQALTSKIPNAMQLTAMYGSNMDASKEPTNQGSSYNDKSAVAAGALYNMDKDTHNTGVQIAFKNELLGIPTQGANGIDEDQSVTEFLKSPAGLGILEKGYGTKLEKMNEQLRKQVQAAKDRADGVAEYDDSKPFSLPRFLNPKEISQILEFEREDSKTNAKNPYYNHASANKLTDLYGEKFTPAGRLKNKFISTIGYMLSEQTVTSEQNKPIIIPFDLDLEIDGTGGIYPGNSFHSTYLPINYQRFAMFQMFDVSHKVDSSGWTTSINGKMRSTMSLVSNPIPDSGKISSLIDNTIAGAKQMHLDRLEEAKQNEIAGKAKDAEETKKYTDAMGINYDPYG